MANREHLSALEQGIGAWNQWRKDHPLLQPDLSEADLSKAYLSGANLSGLNINRVDLSEADLSATKLIQAKLYNANLSRAKLNKAVLSRAILNRANLQGTSLHTATLIGAQMRLAKLNGADLNNADLNGANLYEADLNGASVDGADLYGADLSGTVLSKKEIIDPSEIASIAEAYSYSPNIQEVVQSQLKLINSYYSSVLEQARQSFRLAFAAALVGLLFFIVAVSILIIRQPTNIAASTISVISGALVEVISGINFYLYGRASNQLGTFHIRLDKTQNFLLADAVCESLEGTTKQTTRAKLVGTIANAYTLVTNDENKEVEPSSIHPGKRIPTKARTTKRT
jgi:uncharacterized protein YjbI with pentapeptide repeats